jgi:hypothetical protein
MTIGLGVRWLFQSLINELTWKKLLGDKNLVFFGSKKGITTPNIFIR